MSSLNAYAFEGAAERWRVHYPNSSVSENMVRRIVERVGRLAVEVDDERLQQELAPPRTTPGASLIVQADGGMLPTRGNDSWREAKLGIVARAEQLLWEGNVSILIHELHEYNARDGDRAHP